MSFWPKPDIEKNNIYELVPRVFTNRGIRLLLLDVDNTLAPYTTDDVSLRLEAWAFDMRAAGLELYILSNNRGGRPEHFASALGIEYVKKAKKPFTKTARAVLEEKGVAPSETAIIGDQIYTDTLCANRLGALAVLVEPIEFSNFFLRFRYWLEGPFRNKNKKKK